VLATAILDRLLHHCDVLAINGPSYRLKDRLGLLSSTDPHPKDTATDSDAATPDRPAA